MLHRSHKLQLDHLLPPPKKHQKQHHHAAASSSSSSSSSPYKSRSLARSAQRNISMDNSINNEKQMISNGGGETMKVFEPAPSITSSADIAGYFGGSPSSTPFEPEPMSGSPAGGSDVSAMAAAPEEELTTLAMRLAVLEKAASGVGAIGFVWATVVLLGGFAIALEEMDFWCVAAILLVEGTRIFSRSHELEWQHHQTPRASWSSIAGAAGRSSFRAIQAVLRPFSILSSFRQLSRDISRVYGSGDLEGGHSPPATAATAAASRRTRSSPETQLRHGALAVFLSNNIGRLLYWLQLASAAACATLSLLRLSGQSLGAAAIIDAGDTTNRRNRRAALNIFYGLALAEALTFLAERAYWEWQLSHRRLLELVNCRCAFGPHGMAAVTRFFYDAYSRSVAGSIFDGLKMDMVGFADELLVSGSRDEQLVGVRIMRSLAGDPRSSDGALRRIGASTAAMERLVEMLNWKNPGAEEEMRLAAAEVVSKLAGKRRNALRVAGIAGAMESISSLLYSSGAGRFSELNLLGLLILKKLSADHDNCGKIGNTRGLLERIVDFTGAGDNGYAALMQIRATKRALQVIKMLAGTTGSTGKTLRREISEIVFTVSNIREILRHGGGGERRRGELRRLCVEILTRLAMDDYGRGIIGSTGGMTEELLRIFFLPAPATAAAEAGEAVAMLVLESRENCRRVMSEEGVVARLVAALEDPDRRVSSGRILRNLCAFAGDDDAAAELPKLVAGAIPVVMKSIMTEEMKPLEVSIGLAAQICRLSPSAVALIGSGEGIAGRLVGVLKKHDWPSTEVPRMRRFAIELAIVLMMRSPDRTKGWTDRFG